MVVHKRSVSCCFFDRVKIFSLEVLYESNFCNSFFICVENYNRNFFKSCDFRCSPSAFSCNYGVKTVVSMNSIMVDGTGMCGGCRLTVGGKTKYACVDGPEFDGHAVDFEEAISRSRIYKEQESEHYCRLTGGGK